MWEKGFREVRGKLTEGRYLVLESLENGLTLSASNPAKLTTTPAVASKETEADQRIVIHATARSPATTFMLTFPNLGGMGNSSSTQGNSYLGHDLSFVSNSSAAVFDIQDQGNGQGYTVSLPAAGMWLNIDSQGQPNLGSQATSFKIYAVTF
jgi:hypothetical protein